MSEERSGTENVEKLRKELKELIDHRIEYNNGFANLLRGDYSLFLSLIALFGSAYGAWRFGFWPKHYVLSVYLMFGIWLISNIIDMLLRAPKRAPTSKELEDLNKLLGTKEPLKEPNFGKFLENIDIDKIKILMIWGLQYVKSLFYALGLLFLLSIPMLLIIGERRLWLWIPAILLTIILLFIARKGVKFFIAMIDDFIRREEVLDMKSDRVWKWTLKMIVLVSISFLAIWVIFLYYIISELFFIILKDLSAVFEVLSTMFLILISLAFLSEYISMKFMVTEVSEQNYNLFVLRTKIDRIEDSETLYKHRKELYRLFLPKARSFFVFFNYYYLMLTPQTFEVDEGEEESNRD